MALIAHLYAMTLVVLGAAVATAGGYMLAGPAALIVGGAGFVAIGLFGVEVDK